MDARMVVWRSRILSSPPFLPTRPASLHDVPVSDSSVLVAVQLVCCAV
jgi:hypothetical protein